MSSMIQRLRCCFEGRSSSPDGAAPAEQLSVPPLVSRQQLTPGASSVSQGCQQDVSLLEALLNSCRTADAQDWIYRCILQLDAAAALLNATIRLYVARDDGRFELLVCSIGAELSGGPFPGGVGTQGALVAVKLETTHPLATLGSEELEPQLFGFDTSGPARIRYFLENSVAAVPLSCGTGCFGVLMLTTNKANVDGPFPLATEDRPEEAKVDFTCREPQLLQLGMALSLALTPELPSLRRLAASLARLSASASLRETVGELCDALSYHVRQRFLLEPSVRAALVAEADATTAFLLDVTGVPSGQQSSRRHLHQQPQQQQQIQQQQNAGSPLLGLLPGGLQQSGPPPRVVASTSAARSVSPFTNLSTVPGEPVPQMPRQTAGQAPGPRLAAVPRPGGGKPPSPLAAPRIDATLAAPPFPTAGSGPEAGCCPADRGAAPQSLRLSPSNVAAACEAAGGSVVARPFQLSYSLLLRLQMQQPRMYGIAVRDCARLVQDVNQPSRDICLIMGSAGLASAATVAAAASSILGDSPCQPGSSYGFRDGDPAAPVPYLTHGSGLNGGTGAGATSMGGGGTVQSLALVGCDAGDGVTCAFYVTFPHRLPGQLVEAVRDSCQRLLERVLLRAIGPKVTGDLSAELGALRRGTPGAFAVVQMPYSRAGSNLGVTSPNGPGASVLGMTPALTCSTALTTTASTLIVPAPAPASGGNTIGMAGAIAGPSPPPPPVLSRAQRAQSGVCTTQRNLAQLDAGCAGSSLHGAVSARVIASSAVISGISVGPCCGATNTPTTALVDLLSRSSSTSASRSRSAATARQHNGPPGALGGGGVISGSTAKATTAGSEHRRTLAGGSGLINNLSEVVVLPSRGRIIDATLLNAGGAESWVQAAAPATGPTCTVPDALQTLLSSSQCVTSGSQLPISAQEADMIRRAASVIVVREMEADARGGCQHQLGALVSSVRDSITFAAATAATGVGGGGSRSMLPSVVDTAAITAPQLHDTETVTAVASAVANGSTNTGRIRAATSGGYIGWEDSGAGAGLGFSPASNGATTTITTTTTTGSPHFAMAAAAATAIAYGGVDLEAGDVADLRLIINLGQGGGGCVFLGQMAGGLEVAVKLLELPTSFDVANFVEHFSLGPDLGRARGCGGDCGGGTALGADLGTILAAEAARQQVRARRSLLQSATELAMLTSISHPNIVQVYGIYSNVILETVTALDGGLPTYRLRHHTEMPHEEHLQEEEMEVAGMTADCNGRCTGYSNVCSAVCMTLCDLGSLATALTDGGFPNRRGAGPTHQTAAPAAAPAPGAMLAAPDPNSLVFGAAVLKHMRSVYLTLLEVALALRYLHGRNIVHRDLKPGNILLKSRTPTPADPRGFTTKLADFGLALVLDRESLNHHNEHWLTTNGHTGNPGQQQQHQGQQLTGGGAAAAGISGPGLGRRHQQDAIAPPGRYVLQDQACGTVDHMAPEACRGKGSRLTSAVDVYSFGVVMLEVVTGGRRPFGAVPAERIGRLVMAGTRPLFPAWVPQQYRCLAEACWAHDPQLRPSAAQLVVALRQQLQRYPMPSAAIGTDNNSAAAI